MCESGIDKICSLNSIVKPPRVDLSDNGLLVIGRELGGMATRIVLFVEIHFISSLADSIKAYTGFVSGNTIPHLILLCLYLIILMH